jgi:hypothetical protein
MADTTTNTDATTKPPDVQKDEQVQADANVAASNKALTEVQPAISGPAATGKPADATKPAADLTAEVNNDLNSTFDGLANFASTAWDGASSDFASLTNAASNSVDLSYLTSATDFFSSPVEATTASASSAAVDNSTGKNDAAPAAATDNTTGKNAPASDSPATPGSSVAVKDGQIKVNNDQVTAGRDATGKDTVTEKGSGETYTRDGHVITDKAADRTTKIAKDHIDDHMAGADIKRLTTENVPEDLSSMKPGEILQGKNGVAYKAEPFDDNEGGGTAFVGTDGTKVLVSKDGDKLAIHGDQVEWSPSEGGKPKVMTLEAWQKEYGKKEFAGFDLGADGQIFDAHNHVAMKSTPPGAGGSPATPGSVTVTKTNPDGGDLATVSVNSNGLSYLNHTDAQGKFLSDSQVNYNDPDHAYQQLDNQGNVVANYDLNNDTFQGSGFAFNDSGMQITDGNIFVADNGSYSADGSSDFISTDGSLSNYYTGAGSDYGSMALDSGTTGLSLDDQADVASQLQVISADPTGSADDLIALRDLTGGKLNLSPLIERAEAREERAALRQDRRNDKTDRNDKIDRNDPTVLDFGVGDIYDNSAA